MKLKRLLNLADLLTRKSFRDLMGLKVLKEENIFKNYILVSQDPINTRDDNFQALYWEKFLDDLWADKFCC